MNSSVIVIHDHNEVIRAQATSTLMRSASARTGAYQGQVTGKVVGVERGELRGRDEVLFGKRLGQHLGGGKALRVSKDYCRQMGSGGGGGVLSLSDSKSTVRALTWAAAASSCIDDVEVMALATRNSMERFPGTAMRQIWIGQKAVD